jgi:hypothetical protein
VFVPGLRLRVESSALPGSAVLFVCWCACGVSGIIVSSQPLHSTKAKEQYCRWGDRRFAGVVHIVPYGLSTSEIRLDRNDNSVQTVMVSMIKYRLILFES